MALSSRVAAQPFILALVLAYSAAAANPAGDFEDAARLDLEGKPQLAYAAYLNAADAGLPDAEFNVAVMLDSGRGVSTDPTRAATWYARAASHGFARAAYNLGQLYESGLGVPRNVDLARAWFEASKVPASRDHLAHGRVEAVGGTFQPIAPVLVAPAANEIIKLKRGVELVWTSDSVNEPAVYYVELRSIKGSETLDVLSQTTKVSSLFVAATPEKSYVWRVTMILRNSGQYAVSDWRKFSRN